MVYRQSFPADFKIEYRESEMGSEEGPMALFPRFFDQEYTAEVMFPQVEGHVIALQLPVGLQRGNQLFLSDHAVSFLMQTPNDGGRTGGCQ